MGVRLYLFQIPLRLQVLDDGTAAFHSVHTAVLARFLVHLALVVYDADDGQIVTQTQLEVVGVVCGRDLDRARAEAHLDIVVRHDGYHPVGERQTEHPADIRAHLLVLGVDGDGGVAEHGLGASRRYGDAALSVNEGIAVIPQVGLLFVVVDFRVRKRRLAMGAPVDDAVAAVDEPFLVIAHECVHNRRGQVLVHGERLFRPVAGSAQPLQLFHYSAAVLLFPLPRALQEPFPADIGFGEPFALHLLHDFDFRRDGGVVGAGEPQRLVTLHTLKAREDVLNRLIQRVPHVKLPRDVGGRHHYGERLFLVVGMSLEILALEPEIVYPLLESGIVGLVHLFHIQSSSDLVLIEFSLCRSLRLRHRAPRGARP